jgi:hypothetical protein
MEGIGGGLTEGDARVGAIAAAIEVLGREIRFLSCRFVFCTAATRDRS